MVEIEGQEGQLDCRRKYNISASLGYTALIGFPCFLMTCLMISFSEMDWSINGTVTMWSCMYCLFLLSCPVARFRSFSMSVSELCI